MSAATPSPGRTAAESRESLTAAARDVLAERRRQVEAEGWTPEHDDRHRYGQIALAAGSYAMNAAAPAIIRDQRRAAAPGRWPWSVDWWKPADPRRDLVKAGALILAEIERLDRAEAQALPSTAPETEA